jgi:hypothetical protein
LSQNLRDLRFNLSSMGKIKAKLKKQKIYQVRLLENIESSLKITRDQ